MSYRRGYWTYYEPSRPREVEDGIKTKKRSGEIGETWWSRRWIDVLESFDMGARLTRGRSYARKGQVMSIDVNPGLVRAKVQGSRATPYSVEITLKPMSGEEWKTVTRAMASKAIFAAKLLAGEMPPHIEEAFDEVNIPLFPESGDDLVTDCSCPDWANPCKHIAAVYYLLAERFDDDPFLIFRLRGMEKEDLMDSLRKVRGTMRGSDEHPDALGMSDACASEGGTLPLDKCLENFWTRAVDSEPFPVNIGEMAVENAILKILGNGPFDVRGTNISNILETAYESAGREAIEQALKDSGGDGKEE